MQPMAGLLEKRYNFTITDIDFRFSLMRLREISLYTVVCISELADSITPNSVKGTRGSLQHWFVYDIKHCHSQPFGCQIGDNDTFLPVLSQLLFSFAFRICNILPLNDGKQSFSTINIYSMNHLIFTEGLYLAALQCGSPRCLLTHLCAFKYFLL